MATQSAQGLMQRLDGKLHEKCAFSDLLEAAEKKTGIRRLYLSIGLLSILALYLVVGFGAELICNSIGFVYPAYASMHALESSNKDDDTKWLTYWVVFASFSVVEFFSDIFLDWFPFYWLAKCVFLIWCFAPIGNNGSQVLYNRIIRPFFLKNKERIDNVLSKGMEKVASYASSAVGEAAKHVAEESMKKD